MESTIEKSKTQNFQNDITYIEEGIGSKKILKAGNGNITLFAFDKEQFLSEHTAPFDALVQVLEGEAIISIAGEPYHLKTGDSIILPAKIPHAVNAPVRFKMLLTMIKS